MTKRWALAAATALVVWGLGSGGAIAADCPPITMSDTQGLVGKFPQQFGLTVFEEKADCTLSFSENPNIAMLNGRIEGNPELPPLGDRLPEEPLVVVPYNNIGTYGGVLTALSNATEAGTSDVLSLRHVNLVRYSDDLQVLVPNIAKGWEWNDDYTELTFFLREGHKWSDGAPFTAADIDFWFNDLIMNNEIFENTPSLWLINGEPIKVEAIDETTVKFVLPSALPGLLNRFAISYIQPFQPKHFLSQFHAKYNPEAAEMAKERGEDTWVDLLNIYFSGSDWKDSPSPLLKDKDNRVMPTLESHILIEDTTSGRRVVANPYFHMVDTAGQQLPYINEINELYVPEKGVRDLKIINGEVTYKLQNLFLEDFPLYKKNEPKGGYTVYPTPTLGESIYYAFNVTDPDPVLREIFADPRFRKAMSVAINREEISELVYLGQGIPMQATPAEAATVAFLTDEHMYAYTEFAPDEAREFLEDMGLKDSDDDGIRELPNGEPFIIQVLYANQGGPVKNHELVQGFWKDVGVNITLREVSTDEYRSKAQSGTMSVTTWRNANRTGPTVSQTPFVFHPPFGDEWQPGTGFGWATWKTTDGKEGIEPPADAKKLWDLAEQFVRLPLGSPESNDIGRQVADIHAENIWKIGLVGNSLQPVIAKNSLGNFKPFTVATYDYYWAYPFRPQQWYLSE